jgi:serine/threonine protein kinase
MIVTEWMPNGSLEDILRKRDEYARLSPTQKVKIVVGICKGMGYIHASHGMHRDLKPANILLDRNFEPRIADFGSCKFSSAAQTLKKTAGTGTPLYMAPEAYGEDYDQSVDIYSFAMMLWEIVSGKSLLEAFRAMCGQPVRWLKFVSDGKRPPLDGFNPTAKAIIEPCWDTVPSARMGWNDVLDRLRRDRYDLVGAVDELAVNQYLADVEDYENDNPPGVLDED